MYRNRLYAPRALYGMQDFAVAPLPRGSRIKWTGVVIGSLSAVSAIFLGLNPGRQGELEQTLSNAGFTADQVDFKYEGETWQGRQFRIIVSTVTPVEYSESWHAFSVIRGMVANVYGMEPVNVTEQIENVPYKDAKTGQDTYHGAPAVKDPADAANKKDPAECNWDTQTMGEYLACQLGFNSTSSATMVVIGALVLIGIVALKK